MLIIHNTEFYTAPPLTLLIDKQIRFEYWVDSQGNDREGFPEKDSC
jgi:hypothetical protein